jgi:type VI secretion system Hcp family effector
MLWAGAAILAAVVLAVPLWLVLDDDGARRTAALASPTPGAADIGTLTLVGPKIGTLSIPVQSFSFTVKSPRDAATGQATSSVVRGPLDVVKPIDANSPALFKTLVGNDAITTAKLDLAEAGSPESEAVPYVSYEFTNAKVRSWRDGTSETIGLSYQSVTAKQGKAAAPPPAAELIGRVTYQGGAAVPITAFETGLDAPYDPATGQSTAKRRHLPASIVQPLDGTAPSRLTGIQNNVPLGQVKVELQRDNGGKLETYATYTYTGASAAEVADSGAAGKGTSQLLAFVYQSIEVSVGGVTATDSLTAP